MVYFNLLFLTISLNAIKQLIKIPSMENRQMSVHQKYDHNTTRTLTEQSQQARQYIRKSYKQPRPKLTQLAKVCNSSRKLKCRNGNQIRPVNKQIKIRELNQYINLRTQNQNNNSNSNYGLIKLKPIDTFVSNCLEKHRPSYLDKKDGKNGKKKQNKEIVGKQIPIELSVEIKQIFRHIEVLKNYGFSQKKLTKWMNNFLDRKSQLLRDAFLKSYMNKKSLQNSMIYERWTNLDSVLSKMGAQYMRLNQSESLFLLNEIRCFKHYFEEIVIKKTQSNLDEIFNIGEVNPLLKLHKEQFVTGSEVAHFIKDLKVIEDRYGQLTSVSKFNRTMFNQVFLAEEKFSNEFYSHLDQ